MLKKQKRKENDFLFPVPGRFGGPFLLRFQIAFKRGSSRQISCGNVALILLKFEGDKGGVGGAGKRS